MNDNPFRVAQQRFRRVLRRLVELDTADSEFAVKFSDLQTSAKAALEEGAGAKHTPAAMERARLKSAQNRKQRAEEVRATVLPLMRKLREDGKTAQEIATYMNEKGIKPVMGTEWTKSKVDNFFRQ